jgi:hypothetical protein
MKMRKKAIAPKSRQQISKGRSQAATPGVKAGKGISRAGTLRGGGYGSFKGPSWQTLGIRDFYRPLKKPVTLRLDADVIAWFKKDGSRYQTRINSALRKVMEREMKAG